MISTTLLLAALTLNPVPDDVFGGFLAKSERESARYREAIDRAAGMVQDRDSQRIVNAQGLDLLNLTWEDTGRYKGSSVGPNISDLTIQVLRPAREGARGQEIALMPVVRFPNFSDLTGDMDPRDFTLLVGNHRGRGLKRTSLYDLLARPTEYMSRPGSWPGSRRTLLAERDDRVLVSAQACLLPVPKGGKATFNPVLFNYQSRPGDPAVLTILATREGTSMTVIDNQRDAFASNWGWGQRLFHNVKGQRASLTGERLSDFKGNSGSEPSDPGLVSEDGLSMVLLIQVPLKQRRPDIRDEAMEAAGSGAPKAAKAERSGMEAAVIGHGDLEGPFVETGGLAIERDPRFPVRVTVQFYKATDSGRLSPEDARQIKRDIDKVYKASENVGSLVTGGRTGRPTEYEGSKVQPRDWWEKFWRNYEAWSGTDRETARWKLAKTLGNGYTDKPVTELYLRDLLR